MAPALERDRLSPTREEKLQCKVCLHPYLEQGGAPLVERGTGRFFSLVQMGANNSSLTPFELYPEQLGYIWSPELKEDIPDLPM